MPSAGWACAPAGATPGYASVPAKLFQDGSGGGRTAAMIDRLRQRPWQPRHHHLRPGGTERALRRAHAAGFQLAAHAIGDRAITMILDAYEQALTTRPESRPSLPHRALRDVHARDHRSHGPHADHRGAPAEFHLREHRSRLLPSLVNRGRSPMLTHNPVTCRFTMTTDSGIPARSIPCTPSTSIP